MNLLKWKGLEIDPMKIVESHDVIPEISKIDTAFQESTNESGITTLYPKIEAIHAGRTRNYNRYEAEKLKGDMNLRSGVYSWTDPYPKPLIFNHNTETECVGRVYSASYSDITQAGRPGIVVVPKITHEKTIRDILDGRLMTVSIGATTNAAVCSACGTDIINEGFCGHMRGEEHEGEMVEWICGDVFFDELSWVNVPADSDAIVVHDGVNSQSVLTTEKVVVTTTKEELNFKEKEEKVEMEETKQGTAQTEEKQEEQPKVEEQQEVNNTVELEEKIQVLEASLSEAQSQLEEEKRVNQSLLEANAEIAKEMKEMAAEFLAKLRVSTKKAETTEEAKEKLASRTIESIKDAIADEMELLSIKKEEPVREKIEVEKPVGEKMTESTQKTEEKQNTLSNEDVLKNLFGVK